MTTHTVTEIDLGPNLTVVRNSDGWFLAFAGYGTQNQELVCMADTSRNLADEFWYSEWTS